MTRLHKEHGLNPTIGCCFYCMKQKDVIYLLGDRVKGAAPLSTWIPGDYEPCAECKAIMTHGIIMISVKTTSKVPPDTRNWDPYRTGGWCAVTEAFVRRAIKPELLVENLLKTRFCFVPDDAWEQLGLPRGEQNLPPSTPTSFAAFQQQQQEKAHGATPESRQGGGGGETDHPDQ